jgi:hypothetical protein
MDNSDLINPDSIRIEVEFDEREVDTSSIYPLCNGKNTMALGRSLSKGIVNNNTNAIYYTDGEKELNKYNIQTNTLKNNDSETDGKLTNGEFELVWSDLNDKTKTISNISSNATEKVISSIIKGKSISSEDEKITIDASHVLIDWKNGSSFNGSKAQDSDSIDLEPFKNIKKLRLKFNIKETQSIGGMLSKVVIHFEIPESGGMIPKLMPNKSSVDNNLVFAEEINSKSSEIRQSRALILNTVTENPREFSISMTLNGTSDWKDINKYMGVYWEVTDIKDLTTFIGHGTEEDEQNVALTTTALRTFYIYHDSTRSEDGSVLNIDSNIETGKKVYDETKDVIERA